jgi:uncharacterized protein (DUF1800 family)
MAGEPIGESDALHLVTRAGFGPKGNDVRRFGKLDRDRAVDRLVDFRPSRARGPGRSEQNSTQLRKLQKWWLRRMMRGNPRLHEKVALFWHDHFACSYSEVKNVRWMAQQNRVFREFGMGPFRELLYQVAKDPAMLDFLDGRRNTKNRPNENWARELMELFTLGVFDRAGAENYTQNDVVEMARSTTGYRIIDDEGIFTPSRFDNGDKVLFATKSFEASGNLGIEDDTGAQFPPERNILDILFAHRDSDNRPTLARFIALKLWEWFAYPGPSLALVDELADVFVASGYVVGELVRAILKHDEFYAEPARSSTVKTPVEFALNAIRILKVRTSFDQVLEDLEDMGMELFRPPTVNGWAHGFTWLSTGQFLSRFNFAQALAAGRKTKQYFFKPVRVFDESATDAAQVVDEFLGLLQLEVSANARQALIDYMGGATDFRDPNVIETKVRGLVVLLLTLPEFQIQ